MAHTLTTELSLIKPTPGTHEPYGFVNENANLDTIDALFNSTTGHAHNAAHKGALIAFTGMVNPIASPHMTSPVVDSGGLTITAGGETITAGGLTVTAGNVGIGSAPQSNVGLQLSGTSITAGTTAFGIASQSTFPSAATTEGTAVQAQLITAAAAFTMTTGTDFHAYNPSKGAGSTITSAYGLLVDSIIAGGTNNYGVYINAPSGGSGTNAALVIAGGDAVMGVSILANGATTGFLGIPGGGGAPTGVPVNTTAFPCRFNTGDNKLYIYAGGAWKASGAFV